MYQAFEWPVDLFDEVCIAPESPEREVGGYRKPSPKFELEMIKNLI